MHKPTKRLTITKPTVIAPTLLVLGLVLFHYFFSTTPRESVSVSANDEYEVLDSNDQYDGSEEDFDSVETKLSNEEGDAKLDFDLAEIELNTSYPKAVSLILSDGVNIDVMFKLDDFAAMQALFQSLKSREGLYNVLVQASESGISAASLEVFRLLNGCHELNSSLISNAYQAEQTEIACRGITQQQIDERSQWIDKGVEQGAFGALLMRAREFESEDREKAYELYRRAWDEGHTGTTLTISRYLREGVPNINSGQPDLITSYAFAIIHTSIERAAMSSGGKSPDPNAIAQMDQFMAVHSSQLSYDEVISAQELAQQILKDNEHCCVNLWDSY